MNESCIRVRYAHLECSLLISRLFRCHSCGGASAMFMSHRNESCHIWMCHVTYGWGMSRMNESCCISMRHVIHERVVSHLNESCHIWMSHVTYEWVMSHRTYPSSLRPPLSKSVLGTCISYSMCDMLGTLYVTLVLYIRVHIGCSICDIRYSRCDILIFGTLYVTC